MVPIADLLQSVTTVIHYWVGSEESCHHINTHYCSDSR